MLASSLHTRALALFVEEAQLSSALRDRLVETGVSVRHVSARKANHGKEINA